MRTVLDGKYDYSYSDGDIWFEWSPRQQVAPAAATSVTADGTIPDIAVVKADGKEVHNLTDSGYSDSNGKWVLDGKAMLFESDRAGYRSHGSWGAESDAYLMFFDLDAYDRFRMSKEELELAEANKDEKEKKADEKEEKKKEDKKKKRRRPEDRGGQGETARTGHRQLPRPHRTTHRQLIPHGRCHPRHQEARSSTIRLPSKATTTCGATT